MNYCEFICVEKSLIDNEVILPGKKIIRPEDFVNSSFSKLKGYVAKEAPIPGRAVEVKIKAPSEQAARVLLQQTTNAKLIDKIKGFGVEVPDNAVKADLISILEQCQEQKEDE